MTDLRMVMKRAWEIKKEDSRNIFALCLKMAWTEAKSNIDKYEEFIPSRKQIGVLYANFKKGTLAISKERMSEIYDMEDEFQKDKYNYGFAYAASNTALGFIGKAVNAVFAGDFATATAILA